MMAFWKRSKLVQAPGSERERMREAVKVVDVCYGFKRATKEMKAGDRLAVFYDVIIAIAKKEGATHVDKGVEALWDRLLPHEQPMFARETAVDIVLLEERCNAKGVSLD